MISDAIKTSDIFQCMKCGDCCKGYGGTFVTEKDIAAIAAYINKDPKLFLIDYCQISGERPVLAQKDDGYCVFWQGMCGIHPVKPRMCRDWPFIKSVLHDISNWYIMAALCPGIRLDAPDNIVLDYVRKVVK